jgi:hypothetical protein
MRGLFIVAFVTLAAIGAAQSQQTADHPEPLQELRRLVTVHRAYERMNNGDLAAEHNDVDGTRWLS